MESWKGHEVCQKSKEQQQKNALNNNLKNSVLKKKSPIIECLLDQILSLMYLLIYLFLPALGLRCCPHRLALIAVCGLLIVVVSLFAEFWEDSRASAVAEFSLSCRTVGEIFQDRGETRVY